MSRIGSIPIEAAAWTFSLARPQIGQSCRLFEGTAHFGLAAADRLRVPDQRCTRPLPSGSRTRSRMGAFRPAKNGLVYLSEYERMPRATRSFFAFARSFAIGMPAIRQRTAILDFCFVVFVGAIRLRPRSVPMAAAESNPPHGTESI
jgi:hypothetical protein